MDQLVELLAQLVGTLREEDLSDPAMAGLMFQLVQILDPEPEAFPEELGNQLLQIPNKMERFKQAAGQLGAAGDPQKLKMIAESMKQAGLLKTEEGSCNPKT